MPTKTPFFRSPRSSTDKFPNAVRVGNLIITSGHVAMDENGVVLHAGDCARQAEIIFERLRELLHQAGSDLQHVAKITAYLADAADYPTYNEIRHRWFADDPPASTTVVSGLVKPSLVVEIEAIAVVPDE